MSVREIVQGGHAVLRGPHVEPGIAQHDGQQLANGRIVVDNEHVPEVTHVGSIGRAGPDLYPPATAGTIDTVWPSATGVSRPWR